MIDQRQYQDLDHFTRLGVLHEIDRLQHLLRTMEGSAAASTTATAPVKAKGKPGRKPKGDSASASVAPVKAESTSKRVLDPAARERIAAAQKARWAKHRKDKANRAESANETAVRAEFDQGFPNDFEEIRLTGSEA